MSGYMLREARERLDALGGLSPRDRRALEQRISQEEQRYSDMARDHYGSIAERLSGEVEFTARTRKAGEESIAALIADLKAGHITGAEAAREVAAMRAEIHQNRARLREAMESESRAWSETDVDAAQFQAALAERAPQLFRDGRGLIELPDA